MSHYILVREETFTKKNVSSMENYKKISPGLMGSSKSLIIDKILKTWVINLKNASHRLWVDKIVHRPLLKLYHIHISIDTTKFLCGFESTPTPKDLDY